MLWYPSGASLRVRSLSRTSLHCPSATSHTRSSREPSVALGCEYFKLVLQRQRLHQHSRPTKGTSHAVDSPKGIAEVDPAAQIADVGPLYPVMLHNHTRHQKAAGESGKWGHKRSESSSSHGFWLP